MTPIVYKNLTQEEIDFLVTLDCGSRALDVPDLIFDPACWEHDVLYFVGHTKKDRKSTDIKFYHDMKNIVKVLPWHKRWKPAKWYAPIPLWMVPCIYYWGVRIGGWTSFNWKRKYHYEDLIYAMTLANHVSDLPKDWAQNVPNGR